MDEYQMLIQVSAEMVQKKMPLLVSIGESATKRSLIKMEMATELGADALLVATPAYNKPSQEGLYQHFKAIAASSKIPLVLYNNPSRTGVSIELPTLLRLVEIENIIGIKESSGSIQVAQEMLYHVPKDFIFLSGEDNLTLSLIALGACGVVSVLSNLKPKEMVTFTLAALRGDFASAREQERVLYPFFKACFCETNPVPIKTMMALLGKAAGHCRLPLAPLKNENIERLQMLLKLSQTKAHHE